MDTEQLKTFLEVSRTRHFGRAAHNLFLSQSAVSSRIKALEEQVGTALFVRSRNDIQLTAVGNRLLNHAENILAAWGRAKHDVALEDEQHASLSIAGTSSLWDTTIQPWLLALHEQAPHIAIHGEILTSEMILRRLMEGTLDIGFAFDPPQAPQVEAKQVASIPLVMVSTTPNLSAEQALSQNYVQVDWGPAFAITHSRHFPHLASPAVHLPLGRIAQDYLLNCGGTAYLAEPTVAAAVNKERLFIVEDAPIIERSAFAMYSILQTQPDYLNTAIQLFD